MFDHLLGLILLGLGIQSPFGTPAVKGDQVEVSSESAKVKSTVKWLEKEIKIASRSGEKEKHEKFRDALRKEQERFRNELEEKKASREAILQERKEAFEQKIEKFKDESRIEKVEKIQNKFDLLNIKLTDRATEATVKITELLDKTIEKVQEEKKNGKDTTTVDAAIAEAQLAISGAQSTISAQLARTYVIALTTEANVRADVSSMMSIFEKDVKTMQEAITAARKAVNTAIRELAKVRGEPLPEAIIK